MTRMKAKHKSVRLCLAFMVVWIFLWATGESDALALSIEEETQMGRQFFLQVTSVFHLVEDDFADTYINDLGQYLVSSLETKPFTFHFYIIQSSDLNAFAGPGGQIFVFTGLIDVMDQVDELAAVIAHEIGHVSARP